MHIDMCIYSDTRNFSLHKKYLMSGRLGINIDHFVERNFHQGIFLGHNIKYSN
jgi:hypothetical protein